MKFKHLLTKKQLDASGWSVLIGSEKIYCEEICGLHLFAGSKNEFVNLLDIHKQFAEKLMEKIVIIPAVGFYSYYVNEAKRIKAWDLDASCAKAIVDSLIHEKRIRCLLAQASIMSKPYTCLFSAKRAYFIERMIEKAIGTIESFGKISVENLIVLAMKSKISKGAWPQIILKHLFYSGWGEFEGGSTLKNMVFCEK